MVSLVRTICAGLVLLLAQGHAAAADAYPTKPIKLIVPWAAGGIVDIRARLIADRLGKALGKSVVVENRPGASATIGASAVARAAPDGYTLLVGTHVDQAVVLASLRNVPYDPGKDFAPIVALGRSCTVLLVHPSLNVNTAAELVALVRSKPGQLTYAAAGIGTPQHLLMEQLKRHRNLAVGAVQYKGSGQALPDVAAGHVHIMFDFVPSSAPYVHSGKLHPLMTGCGRRIEVFPDVPSASEAGFPELDAPSWGGIFAPAGTPAAIATKLNQAINAIQQLPEVRSHLAYAGAEIPIMSPGEFAEFVRTDRPKWVDIVKAAGIEPQ